MAGLKKDLMALAKKAASIKVHDIQKPKPPKNAAMPAYEPEAPRMHMTSKHLPAVADWEVGQEYTLLVRARMTAKEQSEYTNGVTSVGFEVTQVAALNQGKRGGGQT